LESPIQGHARLGDLQFRISRGKIASVAADGWSPADIGRPGMIQK
jgi:hypothetical protein